MKNKLIVILGPTASGKTKLATKLAIQFNGEIISADSRQVYHGMDIGTGKDINEYQPPKSGKQTPIPYHLINIKKPNDNFSLAEFQKICHQKIDEIWQRGNVPFLVGGSGLYIEAILNGYAIPKVKPNLKLRQELEKMDIKKLLKKLERFDKNGYQKTDKKNKRRIIRAIEVALDKKRCLKTKKSEAKKYNFLIIGIQKTRENLNKTIDARVDKMIKQGLVEEVKKIITKYGIKSAPLQTIGYREIIDYLDKKTKLEEAIDLIKIHTRQFAKRQMTWWRGMEKRNPKNKISWLENYSKTKKNIKEFLLQND